MKTVIRNLVIAVLIMAFACGVACSGGAKPKMSAQQIYEDVLAVSGFDTMTPVNKRDYVEIYGIDANNFAENDYVWYVSENVSLNADEVFIANVENEKYVDVLVSLLQKHLDTRLSVAETYSPDEAQKLNNVEITTVRNAYGCWVYYCVGEQYVKMMGTVRGDLG